MTARNFTRLAADLYGRTKDPLPFPRQTQKSLAEKSRRVSFNASVRVVTMPHINDFSEEEVRLLWISQGEYERSRAASLDLVRRMDKRLQPNNPSSSCLPPNNLEDRVQLCNFRGLEGLSKAQGAKRRIRRMAATDVILSEQSYQRQEGYMDPDFIRQLYLPISTPCVQEARMRAVQDQKEADLVYATPELFKMHNGLGPSSLSSLARQSPVRSHELNIVRDRCQ